MMTKSPPLAGLQEAHSGQGNSKWEGSEAGPCVACLHGARQMKRRVVWMGPDCVGPYRLWNGVGNLKQGASGGLSSGEGHGLIYLPSR